MNYSDPAETSTPLLSACYAGNLEIATFLVKNGARVNDRYDSDLCAVVEERRRVD